MVNLPETLGDYWTILRLNTDGEYEPVVTPRKRKDLEEFLRNNPASGVVAACYILPSHEIRVKVDMCWEASSLLDGGVTEQGSVEGRPVASEDVKESTVRGEASGPLRDASTNGASRRGNFLADAS